ncbi:hypothetical protein, partial [Streptomyces sp. NPDC058066]|uniref:hypothetical protein n=1 Tax=Streptomyces sp. NPDC058066 TaxID=3346323 RepID=UPI0036E0D3C7
RGSARRKGTRSPGSCGDLTAVVEDAPKPNTTQRVVLLGPDARSWQACCDGAWECAKEGDALTGIMR